ncbi:hypothetical protein FI667_g8809, partial [Globisporangium splendens]
MGDDELLKLGLEGDFLDVDVASAFANDKSDALDQDRRTWEMSDNGSGRTSVKQEVAHSTQQETMSTLELRRKRNRDSMRRARTRQRKEQEKLETMIDQLEDRLNELMQAKETSSVTKADGAIDTSYSYSAYTNLLRQTEHLRDENDLLSEQIQKHTHFQDRIGKLADRDKQEQEAERQSQEEDMDKQVLRPLLQWLNTQNTVNELVRYARDMLLNVADLTDTLAPTTYTMLGWEGKRTIHANWAHYTMSKRFRYERAETLAQRTWNCTINQDVGEMKQVLTWAQGTKLLHKLSDDAAIIARDINIPNFQDIDHPIRIRYILLVIRTPIPNHGGFMIGTITLNIYGTSVEECLEQRISHKHGMNALTMYAFLFSRIHDTTTKETEESRQVGCNVRLAGRSGDGSLMYARKVLFEALPSILRWENTFVAPILRVTAS